MKRLCAPLGTFSDAFQACRHNCMYSEASISGVIVETEMHLMAESCVENVSKFVIMLARLT